MLTVCADLAELQCGDVLDLLPFEFWAELTNMAFVHSNNNLFLGHFHHLLKLAMLFRRRYLKHLFVNHRLMERFIDYYSKEQSKTALHGYILSILDDMHNHEQKDYNKETNEDEDKWDIVDFFEANDAWNGFADTLSTEIDAQRSESIQTPNLGIGDNEEELDKLLKDLLNDDLNEPIQIYTCF